MKNWAVFLLSVVAAGAATVVVAVTLKARRRTRDLNEIPDIIEDCFDRIRQIEQDLRHLRPTPERAA